MFKKIFDMKYFLISAVLSTVLGIYSVSERWGGSSSDQIKNVDVKTIRQNPGSFRSHYMHRFIYIGGK